MMPQRIRLSRAKGWRLPEGAVNVARPDKLGNVFIVGKHGTRAECAAKYLQLARGFISVSENVDPDLQVKAHRVIHRALPDLKGKDVACWCALDGGACHADVLLALANPDLPLPAWLAQGVTLRRMRLGMSIDDYLAAKRKHATKGQG
jgi:hypothetical protein